MEQGKTSNSTVYLTDVEAAKFLGLRPQTLRNWRQLDKGPPYIKLGQRAIRYLSEDLESFANQRKVFPGDEYTTRSGH